MLSSLTLGSCDFFSSLPRHVHSPAHPSFFPSLRHFYTSTVFLFFQSNFPCLSLYPLFPACLSCHQTLVSEDFRATVYQEVAPILHGNMRQCKRQYGLHPLLCILYIIQFWTVPLRTDTVARLKALHTQDFHMSNLNKQQTTGSAD